MKKYRSERKRRHNFDPSTDGRYTTTVCNIMARKDADRKGGGPRYPTLDAKGGQTFCGHLRAPWNTRRISTTLLRTR